MTVDLQKATLWNRVSAWLLDVILLITLAVGILWGMNSLLNTDRYWNTLNEKNAYYTQQFGLDPEMNQEKFDAMTEEDRAAYLKKVEAADQAINEDEEAVQAYNMCINTTLLTVTISILLSFLILEFAVPLLIGNGQTLGKKVFSLAVVRIDCVRITPLQLLARTLLGKYTVETMIPVFFLIMFFLNTLDMIGAVVLIAIMALQIGLPLINRNHRCLHDLTAGTVVVDMATQRIFETAQDLVDYKTKLHAEQVARQDY